MTATRRTDGKRGAGCSASWRTSREAVLISLTAWDCGVVAASLQGDRPSAAPGIPGTDRPRQAAEQEPEDADYGRRSVLARPAVPVRGRNHRVGDLVGLTEEMYVEATEEAEAVCPCQVQGRGSRPGEARRQGRGAAGHPLGRLGGGRVRNPQARHVHGPMEPRDALQHPPRLQEAVRHRGDDAGGIWLEEGDLEPDPGGPPSIEQPTEITPRPLSADKQGAGSGWSSG